VRGKEAALTAEYPVRRSPSGNCCRSTPVIRNMGRSTGYREPATGNGQREMRLGRDIAERLISLGLVALRITARLPKRGGLVHRSGWIGADFSNVVREASELAAILAASARTARSRADPGTK
jgi:hypothetical protein